MTIVMELEDSSIKYKWKHKDDIFWPGSFFVPTKKESLEYAIMIGKDKIDESLANKLVEHKFILR